MLRLLILLAIVALAALIVVKLVKGLRRPGADAEKSQPGEPPAVEDKLVRCSSCGAYVPREEARPSADGFRCGEPRCRESP